MFLKHICKDYVKNNQFVNMFLKNICKDYAENNQFVNMLICVNCGIVNAALSIEDNSRSGMHGEIYCYNCGCVTKGYTLPIYYPQDFFFK